MSAADSSTREKECDDSVAFRFEGAQPETGSPRWLTFPCQREGADPEIRCAIAIHPETLNGESWMVAGPQAAPTVYPDINCGDMCGCAFKITEGKIRHVR